MSKLNNKFPKGIEVVVSAIIENPKGEILLVKSPKWQNKWVTPGGHVEPGETIAQAVLREVKEEVNLSLKLEEVVAFGELIGSKDFYRPAHFIYFDVLGKTENSEVKLDDKELTAYQWLKPKEALKINLAESYEESIRKYLKFRGIN